MQSKGSGNVQFNMTPMIDIVFNLIIFFMLVSQFSEQEKEEMTLPPAKTAAIRDETKGVNVTINLVDPDRPKVMIFGNEFEPRLGSREHPSELENWLIATAGKSDEAGGKALNIILRADEGIPYEAVATVMLAAGKAKIRAWWVATEPVEIQPR
jgi:biopolymer transport protein ExbD